MKIRILILLLAALAMAVTPACTKRVVRKEKPAATVAPNSGPQVAQGNIPPPPPIADPEPGKTLYVVHILDKATERPIGGAFVRLMANQPEPLFMREPMRRDVVSEYPTPMHGQVHFQADSDGKMKYVLVNGRGFAPYITEAGDAVSGQRHEITLKMEIVPTAKFVVRLPNGDRADNAIVTMKSVDEVEAPAPEGGGKLGARPVGSSNYGNTERCDDLGEVLFNRKPGKYLIIATNSSGGNRMYTQVDWTGNWSEPMVLNLPAQSQTPQ